MNKLFYIFIFFPFLSNAQLGATLHCGFDFTTYLVVDIKEELSKKSISNLKVSIVDTAGNKVINTNNKYSFVNANNALVFAENYKIDDQRWFFPYAQESYLLLLSNTFNAEDFKLKIEDLDGGLNGESFETQFLDLYNYNLYVLCASENERATKFGKKINNQPIEVFLSLKK